MADLAQLGIVINVSDQNAAQKLTDLSTAASNATSSIDKLEDASKKAASAIGNVGGKRATDSLKQTQTATEKAHKSYLEFLSDVKKLNTAFAEIGKTQTGLKALQKSLNDVGVAATAAYKDGALATEGFNDVGAASSKLALKIKEQKVALEALNSGYYDAQLNAAKDASAKAEQIKMLAMHTQALRENIAFDKQRQAQLKEAAALSKQQAAQTKLEQENITALNKFKEKQIALQKETALSYATADKEAQKYHETMGFLREAFDKIITRIGQFAAFLAAAAVVQAFTQAIKGAISVIIDFDQSLKSLEAIAGATATQASVMGDTIKQIAADTKFSAQEVAAGMETIGKAGFTAGESLAMIQDVANLATGAMEDLDKVSSLVITAINAFGMEVVQTAEITDIFANALIGSKLDIDDLAVAFNYVGAAGDQAGLSLNEVSGTLMVLSDNGLRASTMGTGLRKTLLSMLAPNKSLRGALDSVGMAYDDINTNIVGYEQALKNIAPLVWDFTNNTVDMSKAQAFFGTTASQVAAILIRETAQGGGISTAIKSTEEYGSALAMAQKQQEGLGVKTKNLQDHLKNVALAIGDAGLTQALHKLADALKFVISNLESLFKNYPVTQFAGYATAATAIAAAIYGIYNALEALVTSSAFKMLFGGLFTTPLGQVTLAILGVATALTALYSRVKDAPKEFEKLSIEINKQIDTIESWRKVLAKASEEGIAAYESQIVKFISANKELSKQILKSINERREAGEDLYTSFEDLLLSAGNVKAVYKLIDDAMKLQNADEVAKDIQVMASAAQLSAVHFSNLEIKIAGTMKQLEDFFETSDDPTSLHINGVTDGNLVKALDKFITDLDGTKKILQQYGKDIAKLVMDRAELTNQTKEWGIALIEGLEQSLGGEGVKAALEQFGILWDLQLKKVKEATLTEAPKIGSAWLGILSDAIHNMEADIPMLKIADYEKGKAELIKNLDDMREIIIKSDLFKASGVSISELDIAIRGLLEKGLIDLVKGFDGVKTSTDNAKSSTEKLQEKIVELKEELSGADLSFATESGKLSAPLAETLKIFKEAGGSFGEFSDIILKLASDTEGLNLALEDLTMEGQKISFGGDLKTVYDLTLALEAYKQKLEVYKYAIEVKKEVRTEEEKLKEEMGNVSKAMEIAGLSSDTASKKILLLAKGMENADVSGATFRKVLSDAGIAANFTEDEISSLLNKIDALYKEFDKKKSEKALKELADSLKEAQEMRYNMLKDLGGSDYYDVQAQIIEDYAKKYIDLTHDIVTAEAWKNNQIQKLNAETAFKDIEEREENFATIASNLDSIAALYEEGSSQQKAATAAANVAHAAEMAMLVQKNIMIAVGAVANQGTGDPYTAFARIAAMTAAMAGILSIANISFSSSGGSGGGATMQSTGRVSGTGTVLGDTSALSDSIGNTIELLNDIEANQYDTLIDIFYEMQDLNTNITGLTSSIVQDYGTFSAKSLGISEGYIPSDFETWGDTAESFAEQFFSIAGDFGTAWLSKTVTGWIGDLVSDIFGGGQTKELVGAGFKVAPYTSGGELLVQSYQDVDVEEDGGWFHSDDNWTETHLQAVDAEITKYFSSILNSFSNMALTLVDELGVSSAEAVSSYTFDIGKINLKDLTGEEISETLTTVFSEVGDELVESLFYDAVAPYQEIGEGLFETAGRIISSKNIVQSAFEDMGISFDFTASEAIEFSQGLVLLAGDIDTFQRDFESFYESFYSSFEKQSTFLANAGNIIKSIDETISFPQTEEAFKDLVMGLDITTESGRKLYTELMSLSDGATEYYNYLTEIEDFNNSMQDIIDTDSLSSYELSLKELNAWYEEQKETATDLGISLTDLNIAYELQIQSLNDTSEAMRIVTLAIEGQLTVAQKFEEWQIENIEAMNLFSEMVTDGVTADELGSAVDAFAALGIEGDDLSNVIQDLANNFTETSENMSASETAAAEAAAEAAEAAAAIETERLSLEQALLELQGDTVALRALELQELDESNYALQEQIWALEDATTQQEALTAALEETTAQQQTLASGWISVNDALGKSFDSDLFIQSIFGESRDLGINWDVETEGELQQAADTLEDLLLQGEVTNSEYSSLLDQLISLFTGAQENLEQIEENTSSTGQMDFISAINDAAYEFKVGAGELSEGILGLFENAEIPYFSDEEGTLADLALDEIYNAAYSELSSTWPGEFRDAFNAVFLDNKEVTEAFKNLSSTQLERLPDVDYFSTDEWGSTSDMTDYQLDNYNFGEALQAAGLENIAESLNLLFNSISNIDDFDSLLFDPISELETEVYNADWARLVHSMVTTVFESFEAGDVEGFSDAGTAMSEYISYLENLGINTDSVLSMMIDRLNGETPDDTADQIADIFATIQEGIDTLNLSEFETEIYNINKQAQDWTDSLAELGVTASEDLAIIDEWVTAQRNALAEGISEEWQNIINENSLSDTDLQLIELDAWFDEQKTAADELGMSLDTLTEAYDLQKEAAYDSAVATARTAYIESLQEEQTILEDALSTAKDNYINGLNDEIDALNETAAEAEKTAESFESLLETIKELKYSSVTDSELNPDKQMAFVGAELAAAMAKIQSGDAAEIQAGMEDLPTLTSDFLELSKKTSGSFSAYQDDFAYVMRILNEAEQIAGDQKSTAELSLDELTSQTAALEATLEAVNGVDENLGTLEELEAAYNSAKNDLDNSWYQDEIDRLTEINSSVLSLEESVIAYMGALSDAVNAGFGKFQSEYAATISPLAAPASSSPSIPAIADDPLTTNFYEQLMPTKEDALLLEAAKVVYQSATTGISSETFNAYSARVEDDLGTNIFDAVGWAGDPEALKAEYGFATGGTVTGPASGYFLPTTFHGTEHITPDSEMTEVKTVLTEVRDLLISIRDTGGNINKVTIKTNRILDKVTQGRSAIRTQEIA